jgi:hypothetical protein
MNKQKACEAIHNLGGCDAAEEWSKGYDAGITAALDAIEKIPDTDNNADLISRNELQSEIAKGVGECRIRAFEPSVNCILQIIHRLPGVQPAPKWISVHDSLPPDNKPCAVVTAVNGLGVSRLMGRNKIEWTLFGEPVLYWMPLPEPPKDGEPNG